MEEVVEGDLWAKGELLYLNCCCIDNKDSSTGKNIFELIAQVKQIYTFARVKNHII
jgi:hypothetical protein